MDKWSSYNSHIYEQYLTETRKDSFFSTKTDKEYGLVKFDIVAHSNGGLVSRYYIENYSGDYYVRKLITIDTPHYGSSLDYVGTSFDILNYTPILYPMDFDLSSNSRLFTGNINEYFNFDFLPLKTISSLYSTFTYYLNPKLQYGLKHQSPKLNGNANVSTKYYAIGGVDYGGFICREPVAVEFVRSVNPSDNFLEMLKNQAENYNLDIAGIKQSSSDNVIDIMTQFGIKLDGNNIIEYVRLDGTTLIVYAWNDFKYSTLLLSFWHNDVRFNKATHNTVLRYLKED